MVKRNKKKAKNILLVILLVMVSVYLLNFYGVFDQGEKLAVVTNLPIEEGENGNNVPYRCPSIATQCSVLGFINCDVVKKDDKVVLRWMGSVNALEPLEFAIELTSFLERWENTGVVTTRRGTILHVFPSGSIIKQDDDSLRVCYTSPGRSERCVAYERGGSTVPVTSTPLPSYVGREFVEGFVDKYSCSGEFKVDDITEATLSAECDNQPCTDSYSTTLGPNQIAKVVGGDSNYIQYSAFDIPQCDVNVCFDESTVQECTNGRWGNFVPCGEGQICRDAVGNSPAYCEGKFVMESLRFMDSSGQREVTGFSVNEPINLEIIIGSSTVFGFVDASVKIFNEEGLKEEFDTSFEVGKTEDITFLNGLGETGIYYVIVEINHGGDTVDFGSSAQTDFSITDTPTVAEFKMSTELISCDPLPCGPFTDFSRFFVNHPLKVDFLVSEANDLDQRTPFESVVIDATLDGVNIMDQLPTPISSLGKLTYEFQISSPGRLSFTGYAVKNGVPSNTATIVSQVRKPSILVRFLDDELHDEVSVGSTVTFNFATRSDIGGLLGTTNTIRAEIPGGTFQDIPQSSISGSGGEYSFAFSFQERGGYKFSISSEASGHERNDRTQSILINAKDGSVTKKECSRNDQCSTNEICQNKQCVSTEPSITKWFVLVGIIVAVLAVVLVVLIMMKRREPEQEFSL